MLKEIEEFFEDWTVLRDDIIDIKDSSEFDLPHIIKYRTYEFEMNMLDREDYRQYYIRYSHGKIESSLMWSEFDEEAFLELMKELRAWEQ